MPIYHKTPPSTAGSHTAADIDYHTSEAAKVKRNREQAYFNSYDFDAIEVLPCDEGDEEDGGRQPRISRQHAAVSQQSKALSGHSAIPASAHHLPRYTSNEQQLLGSKDSKTNPHRLQVSVVNAADSAPSTAHASNHKHQSYLQRFGVAIFGGSNRLKANHLPCSSNSASASASSSTNTSLSNSTASSLTGDDNKTLKLLACTSSSSSSSSSTSSASARAHSAVTTSLTQAPAQSQSLSSHQPGKAENLSSHRKAAVSDDSPASMKIANPQAATTAAGTTTPSGEDGNFLLPRVMLKYQSAAVGSSGSGSGQHATASNISMSLSQDERTEAAATASAGAASAASAPATSSGASLTVQGPAVKSKICIAPPAKKLSTASSSLSSLGSEELVQMHLAQHGAPNTTIIPKTNKPINKLSGRASSHQSHYSTDKSASSGYYSSNVCSTYSLEEHIYSEPTIELKEKPQQHQRRKESVIGQTDGKSNLPPATATISTTASSLKPVETSSSSSYACVQASNASEAASAMRTFDYSARYAYTDLPASQSHPNLCAPRAPSQQFKQNLKILETSIENLDRHLKSFPAAQEAIAASYTQTGEKTRSYSHLPTIREGHDLTAKPSAWSQDPLQDDSLLDIDLDSFLLDERKASKAALKHSIKGIDNSSFLSDEQEENHYKCAKYINSCPEDAYRVESDIIAPTRSSISGQSVALSMELYPKRYEDQLHFQNTRELLEDVRDKIRLLTQTQETEQLDVLSPPAQLRGDFMPKELNAMISTLKRELELYLERMNQHSELDIRQLCTGLVKNQHIVKMRNAFERRRSLTESGSASEQLQRQEDRCTISGLGPISIRQHITTIKCSSDPNFKMKRKSLSEVFPQLPALVITKPPLATGTQLQRNLNFHQASLQPLEAAKAANLEGSTNACGNGAVSVSGSASGGDSSETNDKDSILEWHRKKPSIWEMYYGTNRIQQTLLGGSSSGKRGSLMATTTPSPMCYPSSRPESDFTLDLPRAEQLRIKMEKEKKFRQRCRLITTFLSLIFFLLTVMVVSLVLTRGKRMFGSMI